MNMIVATDINNGIGYKGDLLFKIPKDMKFFKETTIGDGDNIIIMGSNTFKSIGKSLPNRRNIVLSNTPMKYRDIDGIESYCKGDLEQVLKYEPSESIFFIGGSQIYEQYIDECDIIYQTVYYKSFKADKIFPPFDKSLYDKTILHYGIYEGIDFEISKYTKK